MRLEPSWTLADLEAVLQLAEKAGQAILHIYRGGEARVTLNRLEIVGDLIV